MVFSEKLINLRRREGLSQEQLADRLGVTRQSVSKWENGTATPDLEKLIALADLFGVSVDALVREEEPAPPDTARLERQLNDLTRACHDSFGPYFQYTSRQTLFGLPLVAIRFGRDRRPNRTTCAVGIIAIGNFAVGVISVGLISLGVLSLGMVALGAGAVGMTTIGIKTIGLAAFSLL